MIIVIYLKVQIIMFGFFLKIMGIVKQDITSYLISKLALWNVSPS